ncbi:glycosyltransferase family 2 protein [Ideonella sp. DXS29W]|uniref:Glycosyltransferase family 2 protein n=1 Tax=Ideonella lacteola TaxID=2984193 RepID=A0ABU9BKZ4_9BURK
MKAFWRRSGPPPKADPAKLAAIHVEQVECATVRGWAWGGDGTEGDLQGFVNGRRIELPIRRLPRDDVLTHLGVTTRSTPDCCPGFEIQWRADQWKFFVETDATVQLELRLGNDANVAVSVQFDDSMLDEWARGVLAAEEKRQDDEWPRLRDFLALDRSRWAWVWDQWELQGGDPDTRVQLSLESQDGIVLTGWASDRQGRGETFSIRVGDRVLQPLVTRHDRDDVRRMLTGACEMPGFDLLLPAAIWEAAGSESHIDFEVVVNGRRLTPHPLTLSRQQLADRLTGTPTSDGGASGTDSQLCDACLEAAWSEHLRASGGVEPLGLEPGEAPALPGVRTTEVAHEAEPLLHPSAQDVPSPEQFSSSLWALQRRLNRELGQVPFNGAGWRMALDAALQSSEAQTAPSIVLERFAVMLVPSFCALQSLDLLIPLLATSDIERLLHSDGAWELSLILPVLLREDLVNGTLDRSARVLERIARAVPGGWLNTEVFADVVRALRGAVDDMVLEARDLHRLADAVRMVYHRLDAGPWSRLHDRYLVEAMVELVRFHPHLDEPTGEAVLEDAIRWYATVPSFWAALSHDDLQHPTLARAYLAHCGWSSVLNGATPDASEVKRAMADLRQLGIADADWQARHWLARWKKPHIDLGLPPVETLRTRPAQALATWCWHRVAPVPVAPHADLRRSAQRLLQDWHDAVTRRDAQQLSKLWEAAGPAWIQLASESTRFAGLLHLVSAWAALGAVVGPGPSAAVDGPSALLLQRVGCAIDSAVRRVQTILQRQRDLFSAPPAAWLAVLDWMATLRADDRSPEPWSETLREARAWIQASWGGVLAIDSSGELAANTVRSAPLPGISLLVIVTVSGASRATDRLRRIACTWGLELTKHGAAWCSWRPGDGPVEEEQPAAGETGVWSLQGGGRLALLSWLTRSTAFGRFMFVDDDVHLLPDALHAESGALTEHYHGTIRERADIIGLPWVDPTEGLTVSRAAAQWAERIARSRAGARIGLFSTDEAIRLAHALALLHVAPRSDGHFVHLRRVPGPHHPTVDRFHNFWLPGSGSPTILTTIDDDEDPKEVLAPEVHGTPLPSRIWPLDVLPRPSAIGSASQQLVRLSAPLPDDLSGAPCVIAVARNERVLLPHFLDHYRGLGVRRFFIADNLSTDGSREFLLQQQDVCLYSVDTPYRDSHYGVSWQQALLGEHGQHGWAVVADIDELLVWPGCEREGLAALCGRLDAEGAGAAMALMVDMYPTGSLEDADFERGRPFMEAPCFDAAPCLPWRLGSGHYSNGPTYVSAVRHRLLPESPPNQFTAQKLPLMRYHSGVRLSEGLHYVSGLRPSGCRLYLAHFKYHKGFRAKVEEEVARKQHYNGAEEYRRYRALWTEARGMMFDAALSRRYVDSYSFADIPWN